MLAAMFSGRYSLEQDNQGRYFIDRDGTYFVYILNYLRDPSLLPQASVALRVYHEAQYFRLEKLIQELQRYPCVLPYVTIEEQKRKFTVKYQHWKNVIIETAQQKYRQAVKSLIGHESVVTVTRYASKSDYELGESVCQNYNSICEQQEIYDDHQFFCVDDDREIFQHFIGSGLPLVDFIIPCEDILDCRQFTSLLEKDLRAEGFCVSGSLSHAWRCLQCDVTGFLHQMAFKWVLSPSPSSSNERKDNVFISDF